MPRLKWWAWLAMAVLALVGDSSVVTVDTTGLAVRVLSP